HGSPVVAPLLPNFFATTWRTPVTDDFDSFGNPLDALRSTSRWAVLPAAEAVRRLGDRRKTRLTTASAAGAVLVVTVGAGVAVAAQGPRTAASGAGGSAPSAAVASVDVVAALGPASVPSAGPWVTARSAVRSPAP